MKASPRPTMAAAVLRPSRMASAAPADIETHGANRVVIAGNHVVDIARIVIGVDHADDRDTELVGLGHGDLLVTHVDHEHGVGQAFHVLDAAQTLLQLRALTRQTQRLFLVEALDGAALEHGLQLLEALDGLADRLEVGQHASEPAMVDKGHATAHRLFANGFAGGALGADEEHLAAVGRQGAHEIDGILVERQRLFEIDDVNLVTVPEDKGTHLGVPVTGLVTEMNTGLQHLTHGNFAQCLAS